MATPSFGYGSFSIGFVCGFCLYYAVLIPPKWAILSAHEIEDSSSVAVPIVTTPATPLCMDFERTRPRPAAERDIVNGAPSATFGSRVLKRYIRSRDPSLSEETGNRPADQVSGEGNQP